MDPIMLDEISTRIDEVKAVAEQAKAAAQQSVTNTRAIDKINSLASLDEMVVNSRTMFTRSKVGRSVLMFDASNLIVNSKTYDEFPYVTISGTISGIEYSRSYERNSKIKATIKLYDGENNLIQTKEVEVKIRIPANSKNNVSNHTVIRLPDHVKIHRLSCDVTLIEWADDTDAYMTLDSYAGIDGAKFSVYNML